MYPMHISLSLSLLYAYQCLGFLIVSEILSAVERAIHNGCIILSLEQARNEALSKHSMATIVHDHCQQHMYVLER